MLRWSRCAVGASWCAKQSKQHGAAARRRHSGGRRQRCSLEVGHARHAPVCVSIGAGGMRAVQGAAAGGQGLASAQAAHRQAGALTGAGCRRGRHLCCCWLLGPSSQAQTRAVRRPKQQAGAQGRRGRAWAGTTAIRSDRSLWAGRQLGLRPSGAASSAGNADVLARGRAGPPPSAFNRLDLTKQPAADMARSRSRSGEWRGGPPRTRLPPACNPAHGAARHPCPQLPARRPARPRPRGPSSRRCTPRPPPPPSPSPRRPRCPTRVSQGRDDRGEAPGRLQGTS